MTYTLNRVRKEWSNTPRTHEHMEGAGAVDGIHYRRREGVTPSLGEALGTRSETDGSISADQADGRLPRQRVPGDALHNDRTGSHDNEQPRQLAEVLTNLSRASRFAAAPRDPPVDAGREDMTNAKCDPSFARSAGKRRRRRSLARLLAT